MIEILKRLCLILFGISTFISCKDLPAYNSAYIVNSGDTLVRVESFPDLYIWKDVCNVYVIRDGEHAILIDLGDGSVLSRLSDIGVSKIDWVLFTHHHREQCQGYPLLSSWNTKIAAPGAEKSFFEDPTLFRKSKPSNSDAYTVHASSYIRPPIQSIFLDREFSKMDTFTWRSFKFVCIETPGNSPGSMSYLFKKDEKWIAFSGDVMLDGGKMHNFFDTEWDYGFGTGFRALHNSAALLRDYQPTLLLPSHGSIIRQAETQLGTYVSKLANLERLLMRGYDLETLSSYQDKISKPTDIPFLWQVSPHLFRIKGTFHAPNFSLILSDNGHALMVDCGLSDTVFLSKTIEQMQVKYGLKQIDALIVTHIHGDHFIQAPFVKSKWGSHLWVLENMVSILEQPQRYDFPAMVRDYSRGFDTILVDRAFKPGESFHWEGYDFTMDWMPGQTEFALCMHGIIDGKKVAFTGDNIFGDPDNPVHTGNEALVARNSAILEEGYIYAAEYLTDLKPDLMIGGHGFVMNKPSQFINRYREWAYEMKKALQSVSNNEDYRYWFDPYWVHADPYRTRLSKGDSTLINIVVRNFSESAGTFKIQVNTPSGLMANPENLQRIVDGNSVYTFPVRIVASPDITSGISIIGLDVTLNGGKYGEWFDAIIEINP